MQHLTATLKAMFCLVTLSGLGMAPCTAADQALREGPWFNAKTGTTITYRIKQEMPMPGAAPKVAVISEVVVASTPDTVTLKRTSKAQGEPTRESTSTQARRISSIEHSRLLEQLGYERNAVDFNVSGLTFKCRQYRREIESPNRDTDDSTMVWTTFCRELPGWIASQSVDSLKRFEMLDVKP